MIALEMVLKKRKKVAYISNNVLKFMSLYAS